MIAGKKYLGLNADIWSCGVVLFAMVCGYLPFEDPNTTLLYKKIIAGDYSLPKFVSASAKDLIQGLLTTDPERRLKLRDIKNHPWLTQTCESSLRSVTGIKVGQQSIPVDPAILSQMPDYH
jgi:5'-AMP-activated protein kinase catalytic alpha subunit